jgi:hypothetical protein
MKTADSGVVATFRRPFQNGQRDRNIVIASLEYVGNVEEILELDYGIVCLVVLVCTWVKANYRGPSSIIKKDRWGFTVANFESLIQPGYESFAFPLHVDQVYFSRCPDMPGWKVVIWTEVRGRRVVATPEEGEECEMFQLGRDVDHVSLRVPEDIPEEPEILLPNGRVVRREDMFEGLLDEANDVFDRDIGESSEDD